VIALLSAEDPAYVREAARRGVFAYIVDTTPEELQSAIDITLQRFSEYHNLQGAFGRRAVIEQAKGILMARHGIDADRAFEMLRNHSQHNGQGSATSPQRSSTAASCCSRRSSNSPRPRADLHREHLAARPLAGGDSPRVVSEGLDDLHVMRGARRRRAPSAEASAGELRDGDAVVARNDLAARDLRSVRESAVLNWESPC
jgi:hypothetical protein